MTEDEMLGWYHQLDGHEFEQAPRDGDGQGSLACYGPWGCKESNMTELTELYELTFTLQPTVSKLSYSKHLIVLMIW